jgi:hypothetical protein
MTCRQARKQFVDLLETPAPDTRSELHAHVAGCEACNRELAGMRAAIEALRPAVSVQASPGFKQRVLARLEETEVPLRRRWVLPRFVLAAATALVLVLVLPLLNELGRPGPAPAPVLSLLAQSAKVIAKARSIHIIARMRTNPRDNFEYIDPKADWVPLEIWTEAGPPARWRVEKPGRFAVMNGTASMLVIKPDQVSRGRAHSNYLGWMQILLDTDQLMERELDLARSGDSEAGVTEQNGHTTLTVSRHPRSLFKDDWVAGRIVSATRHTRVYRFSTAGRRLEGMQMVIHTGGQAIPIFEITEIRYDEAFDPALFALMAPANAFEYIDAEQMPVASHLPESPKEAAEMLFDAFSREDWDAARLIYPMTGFDEGFQHYVGGMQVISIGEPFRSSFYPGWFVPYEVRLKSGRVKKWNLAVRNDNSVHRWVFDGGL